MDDDETQMLKMYQDHLKHVTFKTATRTLVITLIQLQVLTELS